MVYSRFQKSAGFVFLLAAALVPFHALAEAAGRTLLHAAARSGNMKEVQRLLKSGINVNSTYTSERSSGLFGGNFCSDITPLYEAAASGHAAVVDILIKAGANVDTEKRCTGFLTGAVESPLAAAAANGDLAVVKLLAESSASPYHKEGGFIFPDRHANPLSVAIRGQHTEVATYLVTQGAKMKPDSNDFLDAVRLGHLPLIYGLLASASGACNQEGEEKKTADVVAAEAGHTEVSKFLEPVIASCPNS